MNAPAEPTFAWEPLTPRGVAAFARANFSRLLLVQFIVALLAAASVVWFLDDGCFPTISDGDTKTARRRRNPLRQTGLARRLAAICSPRENFWRSTWT